MINVNDCLIWHFVGVGGVSMSKLCAYMHSIGKICTGSDRTNSPNIEILQSLGVRVCIGEDSRLAENADIVVYSAAIDKNHKELVAAKQKIERKYLLGAIAHQFANTIAVSGAHGKTTVSGMLSHVLAECGELGLSHVGGDVVGHSDFGNPLHDKSVVVEACEYSRSFLAIEPDIAVVVNVDYDHPDCYLDIEDTYKAFAQFISYATKCCLLEEKCSTKLIELTKDDIVENASVLTFGKSASCDYYIVNVNNANSGYGFEVYYRGQSLGKFYIATLNAINTICALCCVATCHIMGIDMDKVRKALATFKGIKRRMEYIGVPTSGAKVYTDYAHHPKEINALYDNLSEDIKRNMLLVFEPHTYSRTAALYDDFVQVLSQFDNVVILPTYPARETPNMGIDAENLANGIMQENTNCNYFHNWKQLKTFIEENNSIETILLVGAGIDYMGIFSYLE